MTSCPADSGGNCRLLGSSPDPFSGHGSGSNWRRASDAASGQQEAVQSLSKYWKGASYEPGLPWQLTPQPPHLRFKVGLVTPAPSPSWDCCEAPDKCVSTAYKMLDKLAVPVL